MALTSAHRKLVLGQAVGGVACNIPLNAALAWYTFPPVDALPVWARGNCVAGDTLGTSFFLPLITCLILTAITRSLVRGGAVPGASLVELPRAIRYLPRNFVGRGAVVGVVSMLTVGLVTLAILTTAGFEAMTRGQVTVYKAIYCTLLGLAVTPLFGFRALADVPGKADGERQAA